MINSRNVLFASNSGSEPGMYRFDDFFSEVTAYKPGDVVPALKRIEYEVKAGAYAVGFLSYEAASGLDQSLPAGLLRDFPLLWFGICREPSFIPLRTWLSSVSDYPYTLSDWCADTSRDEYCHAVSAIRDYIAAGDIYQVNFTLRESSIFRGHMGSFFRDLCRVHPAPYGAFFDLDRYGILSNSPELFFRLDDGLLTVRPMKGTIGRGASSREDVEALSRLRLNEKDRAENLMIVDLLRNDLGRISESGSVRVKSLFDVETLETVHQMTSTVSSRMRPDVGLEGLFRALFPCGSITGAPKKRSMEIISELESSSRGIYTGCIGYIAPEMHHALFNVAIRTMVVEKTSGKASLGVGSAITWYSDPDAEFEECLLKGLFARNLSSEFTLIESLLYEEGEGYFLLNRHLERLTTSARYFGFSVDPDSVRTSLDEFSFSLEGSNKVRLILSFDGSIALETELLASTEPLSVSRIAFADIPVDSANLFLYHKTSKRDLYLRELEKKPRYLDVVFVNEKGEVTEGAYNNIVIRKNGILITPPMVAGLLPGTFRAHLLESGAITEGVIMPDDMKRSDEIYLINSVRKWRRVLLDEEK